MNVMPDPTLLLAFSSITWAFFRMAGSEYPSLKRRDDSLDRLLVMPWYVWMSVSSTCNSTDTDHWFLINSTGHIICTGQSRRNSRDKRTVSSSGNVNSIGHIMEKALQEKQPHKLFTLYSNVTIASSSSSSMSASASNSSWTEEQCKMPTIRAIPHSNTSNNFFRVFVHNYVVTANTHQTKTLCYKRKKGKKKGGGEGS